MLPGLYSVSVDVDGLLDHDSYCRAIDIEHIHSACHGKLAFSFIYKAK